MKISYRDATPQDIPFVMDSWLNSWKKCPWAGVIRNNHYYAQTRGTIEDLIGRGAAIEVACRDDAPEHILGWICRETTSSGEAVVHYLYVKEPYLPFGIGAALVGRAPGTAPGFYSFRYRQVADACQSREGWRHAPEIARRK
jgi:GNAT superfamily N-acetyltransferase